MIDVFTYGTLMDPEIMERVTGLALKSEQASLKNYVRKRMKNEAYPAILAKPMSLVEGQLYHSVTPVAVERLDAFEGDQYLRQIVTVHTESGKRQPAHVYVLKSEFRNLLSKDDWSLEWFLEHGKSGFMAYEGFSAIK